MTCCLEGLHEGVDVWGRLLSGNYFRDFDRVPVGFSVAYDGGPSSLITSICISPFEYKLVRCSNISDILRRSAHSVLE